MSEGGEQGCFSDGASMLVESAVDKWCQHKTPGYAVVFSFIKLVGLFIKIFDSDLIARMLYSFIALFSSLEISPSLQYLVPQCIYIWWQDIQKMFIIIRELYLLKLL